MSRLTWIGNDHRPRIKLLGGGTEPEQDGKLPDVDLEFTGEVWFPKDGGYIVPIKDNHRSAEDVPTGDPVTVSLTVDTG